MGEQDVLVDPQ